MRSEKDVEAYLLKLNRRFNAVDGDPHTFIVQATNAATPVALRVDAPLVVIRVHIGESTGGGSDESTLFRRLLELNAKSLVHASYGLEGNTIVLSSALELENLDFNEIEATLDEIDMALTQQVPMLAGLNKSKQGGTPPKGSN